MDEINSVKNKYKSKKHSTIKIAPTQASLKKNEEHVSMNILDKRKKLKSKFQKDELVRTADERIFFMWQNKLCFNHSSYEWYYSYLSDKKFCKKN